MTKKLFLIFAVAATAAIAHAQGDFLKRPSPFAGRTMLTLALFEEVRPEIKTTADENTKIDALADKLRSDEQEAFQNANGDFSGIREAVMKLNAKYDDQLVALLTPEQHARLKQLFIQYNGSLAIQNPTIQKDLELTPDQLTKVKAAQDDNSKAMQDAFSGGGAGPDTFTKLQADLKTALDKVLTDDQRAKMQASQGTKFEFKKVDAGG